MLHCFTRSFVVTVLFAAAFVQAQPFTPQEIRQGYRDHAVLAKLRDDPALSDAATVESREGLRVAALFSHVPRLRALELPADETVVHAIDRLRATGRYEFVEPDFLRKRRNVPNDPRFQAGEQWSLRNTGQNGGTAGADIHAVEAWDIRTDASSIVVAIIDSGLRTTHVDFNGNLWRNAGEIAGNLRDDDNDGYIDDVNGIDATAASTSTAAGNPVDVDGHGTAVASVIGAAGNNGVGLTGVAWRVQLMPLRFLDNFGYGTVSASITCLNYAIAHGAQVVNASYGDYTFSQSEFNALARVRDAGIIVVVATDNGASNADTTPNYPANYLLDNIVTVGSTNRNDELSSFSNFGSGFVDLGAPGSSIVMCDNAGDLSYVTESGTSFATPHVTGAIALLKAQFRNENYRDTINRLLRSVDVLPSLYGKTATGGRLNLARALGSTSTAPYNDAFAQRSSLVGESVVARASSRSATRETGEPAHAGATGSGSLWWTWTATRSGTVTVDTSDSAVDTLLAIYTGSSVNALTPVASNDDESATVKTSKLSFTAVAGTTYQVAIDHKGTDDGLVVLRLNLLAPNDAFASAEPVTGRSFVVKGDNRSATRETGEPLIKAKPGGHSLWYRWVAPVTRRYYVSAWCPKGDFDTMLAVYVGPTLSTLAEVVAATTSGAGLYIESDAGTSFQAVAGTTYYIAVDTEDGKVGAFNLSLIDSEWEFFSYEGSFVPPAVAADGTLYAMDSFGALYAINPDGTSKWTKTLTGYCYFGAPAVGADGTIYVGDDANYLYAYAPDGTRKWRYQAQGDLLSSLAIATDGTVYFRSEDGLLNALNPDGSKKWTYTVSVLPTSTVTPSNTAPVIAPDGTIYVGSSDGKLYAVNPDGTKKWDYATGGEVFATPAIATDGTVYLGTSAKTFLALTPTGALKWSLPVGDEVDASAVIGTDGTVYFGCGDHKLYAVSAAGAIRWAYDAGAEFISAAPLIANDGTIYAGTFDGVVHAIDPNGARIRLFCTGDSIISSPLLHNGILYIPSLDYRMYAVDVGKVPANSAWPMEQHNVRRLGRAITQTLAIGVQPKAQAAAVGGTASFTVGAVGAGNLAYQWRLNGTAIPGATSATYNVDPVLLASAGQYSVSITDSAGAVTSVTVALSVSGGVTSADARLFNLATRAVVGTGADILIPGITVSGTTPKQLLIRAAGPTLASFGVSGALARPQLILLKGATQIATNTGWGTATNATALAAAFGQVGAFPFAAGSGDSALLVTIDPGSYTAQVSGVGGTTGVALVEVYEVGTGSSRLANLSCRARVGTGGDILIPGITITGSGPKQLLIRAAGPVLTAFGVIGALAKPRLELFSGTAVKVAENSGWSTANNSTQVAAAFTQVGAFSFAPGSADSALLVTLQPGSYTVQVSGVGGTTGVALVEVYDVP